MKTFVFAGLAAILGVSAAQAQDLEVLQSALSELEVEALVNADDLDQTGTLDSLSNFASSAANSVSASDLSVGSIALAGPTVLIDQTATAVDTTLAEIDIDDAITQAGASSEIMNTAIGALNSVNLGD